MIVLSYTTGMPLRSGPRDSTVEEVRVIMAQLFNLRAALWNFCSARFRPEKPYQQQKRTVEEVRV